MTRSSAPWITSTGQRTREQSARTSSSGRMSAYVAISTSGVVSSPHPTQSSLTFVECGSLNISAKKNSRKSR